MPAATSHPLVRAPVIAAGIGALTSAVLAYQARHAAPYQPVLESFETTSRHLAADRLLRIGFVTDTHIGPTMCARDVERALLVLAQAKPDVLLFGGDFICESPRFIPEVAQVIGDYAGMGRYGALAVLGNHDYSNDAPRLVSALERRGVRVLCNEAVPVGDEPGALWVTGIDDAVLGRPDPDGAFAKVPDGAPVVALWHEPDWAEAAAAHGAFLQLSGHSHGGQVTLPIVGPLAAPAGGKRFVSGLHEVGPMHIYTSRGAGVYRPPVRFNCPPEVTLVQVGPRLAGRQGQAIIT